MGMRSIALIIVLLVFSAGCLGSIPKETVPVQNHTITVTKTVTVTVTEVVSRSESADASTEEMNKSLTSCLNTLSDLNGTLALKEEELKEIRKKYEECLVERAAGSNVRFELLSDDEYYRRVLEGIENAEESIYVMMFLMLYDPDDSFDWANDLIRALVEAKERGVEVHVVLEDGVDNNRAAYEYLKKNGVDVCFDSPSTTLHAKVVIIDGKLVFIGSHNWSESALHWNHEVSIMLVSQEIAAELVRYFEGVCQGF